MTRSFSFPSRKIETRVCRVRRTFPHRWNERKTNDAFVKTALRWNDMGIKEKRVVFLVITLDQGSELFDALDLEMVPTIVYLSESHAVDVVPMEGCCDVEFAEDERDLVLLERDDQIITEGTIQRFVTKNTGVEVFALFSRSLVRHGFRQSFDRSRSRFICFSDCRVRLHVSVQQHVLLLLPGRPKPLVLDLPLLVHSSFPIN